MQVHVLFDAKGAVHALFHPAPHADAPQLRFVPARGQRVAVLDVPAELEALAPHALHAAVAVRLLKAGPRLVKRRR